MDAESYWQGYLAARKERFVKEKAIIIGTEYKSSKKYWDEIINGEWIIFESRLGTGFDVGTDAKSQLGLDFFQPNLDEIHVPETADFTMPNGDKLPLYCYEDFILLSNQGIFRETDFVLDRERRWQPKVEDLLGEHGFQRVDVIWEGGVSYLRFCKRTE
tara:strand:- start:625 stop:1101 length:477 start_codon:yes stop_codon:yes gene_type:complete